jgi:hypothetical protein
MPQNWWEMFPEIQPSPAARPRLLPGPGGAVPGPAMGPRAALPYDAFGPDQAPLSAFDPSYFSDGDLGAGELPSRHPGQATPSSYGQPSFADDEAQPAIDRNAAISHAASAIERGADPNLVRARLNKMGHAGFDPPSPFSDVIPDGGQSLGMAGAQGTAMPAERPTTQNRGDLNGGSYPAASPQQYRSNLVRRSDPSVAPQKADGSSKHFHLKAGSQLRDRARELGRGIPPLVAGTPGIAAGGEPKLPRPRGLPNNVIVSSPRTGGPRDRVPPRRSYSVTTHDLAGGLNDYGYIPQNGDAQLLARAIYSESGVTPEDMLAIGWSIVNRVGFRNGSRRPSFGATLTDVVHQRLANGLHAYSFLNDGGSSAWHRSANPSSIPDPAVWARAFATANAILSRRVSDPSGGAQYFFASSTYDPADWRTAAPGYPAMLRDHHYTPTPYQSASTLREEGRPRRNYFFRENPVKLWAPPADRGRGH